MFPVDLPPHEIGDTLDVTINGRAAKITRRDKNTLVMSPAREIICTLPPGALFQTYICENRWPTRTA